MTTSVTHADPRVDDPPAVEPHVRVRRRLRPLLAATLLQGMVLWVPVEKLFMSEIGFDARTIGIMAACCAAVVPLLEIPSGILADRWSRRGVLMIGSTALMASQLVGALSTNVATYIAAALLLGVFFAMQSGTVDSIIYDTVLEEFGTGDAFEATVGRLRAWESAALVTSALGGAGLAAVTSPRLTCFLTLPFGLASLWALRSFREPRLHQGDERASLRSQVALTYRTILGRGGLWPIIATMVLTAMTLQVLLEFGPLRMVAFAAPALLYGPQWAGLTSAFGVGAALSGRVRLTRPATRVTVVALMLIFSLTLTASRTAAIIIVAQIGLAGADRRREHVLHPAAPRLRRLDHSRRGRLGGRDTHLDRVPPLRPRVRRGQRPGRRALRRLDARRRHRRDLRGAAQGGLGATPAPGPLPPYAPRGDRPRRRPRPRRLMI
jgi:MFS family permease